MRFNLHPRQFLKFVRRSPNPHPLPLPLAHRAKRTPDGGGTSDGSVADTAAEATRRVEAEFNEWADGELEADPESDLAPLTSKATRHALGFPYPGATAAPGQRPKGVNPCDSRRRTCSSTLLLAVLAVNVWANRTGRYQVARVDSHRPSFVVLDTATGTHWVHEGRQRRRRASASPLPSAFVPFAASGKAGR